MDPRGAIIFISQLYEGSISDNEIVKRSGFLDLLEQKLRIGELNEGDGIMADKGFEITEDLKKIEICLNIPPFLRNKVEFEEVIKTETIAHHRIHGNR